MNETVLAAPPEEGRLRELWLNHAAGYTLIRNIREYARDKIDPSLSLIERAAAEKAVDDALYGVTMMLDGIPQPLQNEDYSIQFYHEFRLVSRTTEVCDTLATVTPDTSEGYCMGYHYWTEGNFGECPVIVAQDS